mgnify:CR=1 FL=1
MGGKRCIIRYPVVKHGSALIKKNAALAGNNGGKIYRQKKFVARTEAFITSINIKNTLKLQP